MRLAEEKFHLPYPLDLVKQFFHPPNIRIFIDAIPRLNIMAPSFSLSAPKSTNLLKINGLQGNIYGIKIYVTLTLMNVALILLLM